MSLQLPGLRIGFLVEDLRNERERARWRAFTGEGLGRAGGRLKSARGKDFPGGPVAFTETGPTPGSIVRPRLGPGAWITHLLTGSAPGRPGAGPGI